MIGWVVDIGKGLWYGMQHGWYQFRNLRNSRSDAIGLKYSDDCVEDAAESNLRDAYNLVGSVDYRIEHGRIGRMLTNGETTVYSHEFPYAEAAMFVGHLFCDMNGFDVDDIACIYKPVITEPDKHGHTEYQWTAGRLIFPKHMYDQFIPWLELYKQRFEEGYDFKQLLPLIADGQQVTGYFVDHNCGFAPRRTSEVHDNDQYLYLPDDELYMEWKWVMNNCNGKVRILGDKWVFEDAGDAMMYQLQMR